MPRWRSVARNPPKSISKASENLTAELRAHEDAINDLMGLQVHVVNWLNLSVECAIQNAQLVALLHPKGAQFYNDELREVVSIVDQWTEFR
jgi:hypothetical protein